MGQIFSIGADDVWSPSNGVGLLFARSAQALVPLVDRPSGLEPADQAADEWVIDLPVFSAFVDALVDRYQRSTHLVLRSLMEGFIATALVLVDRGGGAVATLGAEPGTDTADLSVSAAGLGARAPLGRLAELRDRHEAAMPS